jgi:kynurenine 3-monooxygenase
VIGLVCPAVTVDRVELAQHLIHQAQHRYPDQIHFHFQHTCTGVQQGPRHVLLSGSDGVVVEKPYDLLLGTDGVNSVVRKVRGGFLAGS